MSSVGCEKGGKWDRKRDLPFRVAMTAAADGNWSKQINSVAKENHLLALCRKVIIQIIVLLISSVT